jgi:hypothetical protein
MKVPRVAKRDPPEKTPRRARNFEAEDGRCRRYGASAASNIGATGACFGGSKWSKLCNGAN